jgi:PAS domain S-box-containing protein
MERDDHAVQALIKQAVDVVPDMVFVVTTDGRMVFANRSAKDRLGLTDEGKFRCCDAVHGCADSPDWCPASRVAQTGKPACMETMQVGDGSRWYDLHIYPLNSSGQRPQLLHVLTDCTDRKQALDALARSESSLAEAQRIAQLGNWDWNIVENTLYWSDEIYRIFGLEPRQFGATYEAFLESVHPLDREYVTTSVQKALAGEEDYAIDHRIVQPDGTIRTVHEDAAIYRDSAGAPTRMLGTVRDVTEARAAEVRRQELLEERQSLIVQLSGIEDRERQELATELHDRLGQELAMARIGTASLKAGMDGDRLRLTEQVLDALDNAIRETRSLTRELCPPALHEMGLWEALEDHIYSVEGRYGMRIDLFGDRLEGMDMRNRVELFKIVRELTNNAVKHSGASRISIRLLWDGDEVRASVEDDGKGFDLPLAQQVEGAGGFGLFSIRQRLRAFGGQIFFENSDGGGAMVTVALPVGDQI